MEKIRKKSMIYIIKIFGMTIIPVSILGVIVYARAIPKFKVGDCFMNTDRHAIYKITAVGNYTYRFIDRAGYKYLFAIEEQHNDCVIRVDCFDLFNGVK